MSSYWGQVNTTGRLVEMIHRNCNPNPAIHACLLVVIPML